MLDVKDTDINNENSILSYTETIIAQVVNNEDKVTMEAIQRYCNEQKERFNKNVRAIIIDEDKLNLIIKLGIEEYNKRFLKD